MNRPENLKVGDKFKVIDGNENSTHNYYRLGEIITLVEDDGSSNPFFQRKSGDRICTSFRSLEPYKKDLDNLEVGDILIDNEGNERMVLGISDLVFHMSSEDDLDVAYGNFTLAEFKRDGWRLKEEEKKVELTLDEVAEKFGVDVNLLKIRK